MIGAIYLDQGYDVCYKFIRDVMIEKYIDVDMLVRKEINFKSNLIEWSQKNKISISFDLIESFTDHDGNPVFQSAIKLLGEQIGIGIGYSKKESQQAYLFFDDAFVKELGTKGKGYLNPCGNFIQRGQVAKELPKLLQDGVKRGDVFEGNTIEEVAKKAGLNAA